MIRIIKLKEEDLLFLNDVCKVKVLSKHILNAHFESKSKSWLLSLESTDMESICDELTDVLMDKGVTNGEVNSIGQRVDDFIDRFNYYNP